MGGVGGGGEGGGGEGLGNGCGEEDGGEQVAQVQAVE